MCSFSFKPLFFLLKNLSLLTLFLSLLSCYVNKNTPSTSALSSIERRVSPAYIGTPETPYCEEKRAYFPFIVIQGRAKYEKREVFFREDSSGGLGDIVENPIRRAEIRVINSKSQVVQCAETDNEGYFAFTLPPSEEKHFVFINSRAYNQYAKVSVLDSPEQKNSYFLSWMVQPRINQNLGTIVATAKGEKVLGGAFNILDQIIRANEFIKENIMEPFRNNSSTIHPALLQHINREFSHCIHTFPLPKVEIYWQAGFNPQSYYSSTTSKSFYIINSQGRCFISGGIGGREQVNYTDGDHYDDTIIIHEYAHHINNFCSNVDAPSVDSHNGNAVIDPRLAFEEGWANFFQAAVRGEDNYIDTFGNSDGMTGFKLNIPIDFSEAREWCANNQFPGCDFPQNPHEGNFREFSITRIMWDAFNEIPDSFLQTWLGLTSDSAFINKVHAYRSVGLLYLLTDFFNPEQTSEWERLRTKHNHIGNRKEFGQKLIPEEEDSCSSRPFTITPSSTPNSQSHLLLDNDFYQYSHPSDSPFQLELNYITPGTEGFKANLDLYVYQEYERISDSKGLVGHSRNRIQGERSDPELERITLSSLKAGHYLINVRVSTDEGIGVDPGGQTQYGFKINDKRLCPYDYSNSIRGI